jgi:hypothetical protein
MRRERILLLAGLFLAVTGAAQGSDIDGRWSVGAGIGDRVAPSLSISKGSGPRHAWGLEAGVDPFGAFTLERSDALHAGPALPDSLLGTAGGSQQRSFLLGARWRRYSHPARGLAEFLEVHLDAIYNSIRVTAPSFDREQRRVGGQIAAGLGVEWFPNGAPVTVAIQSDMVALRLEHRSFRVNDPSAASLDANDVLTLALEITPRVYARVYF